MATAPSTTTLYDWMKSNKMDPSYGNRSKLYSEAGLNKTLGNFSGTANQNQKLWDYLRKQSDNAAPINADVGTTTANSTPQAIIPAPKQVDTTPKTIIRAPRVTDPGYTPPVRTGSIGNAAGLWEYDANDTTANSTPAAIIPAPKQVDLPATIIRAPRPTDPGYTPPVRTGQSDNAAPIDAAPTLQGAGGTFSGGANGSWGTEKPADYGAVGNTAVNLYRGAGNLPGAAWGLGQFAAQNIYQGATDIMNWAFGDLYNNPVEPGYTNLSDTWGVKNMPYRSTAAQTPQAATQYDQPIGPEQQTQQTQQGTAQGTQAAQTPSQCASNSAQRILLKCTRKLAQCWCLRFTFEVNRKLLKSLLAYVLDVLGCVVCRHYSSSVLRSALTSFQSFFQFSFA